MADSVLMPVLSAPAPVRGPKLNFTRGGIEMIHSSRGRAILCS